MDAQGVPNNTDSWARHLKCDNQGSGQQTVPVRTNLQRGVVTTARSLSYLQEDTAEQILFGAYQACASNDSEDYYATTDSVSPEQAAELNVWMSLCPKQPSSRALEKGARGVERERQG